MSEDIRDGGRESSSAASNPGLAPGMTIGDGFTLLRPLGSGGMGEVWLAHEKSLRRDVALKILLPTQGEDDAAERAMRRFSREERLLARCSHPAILPIWESGTDATTGRPYYATRPCLLTTGEERRLREALFGRPHPVEDAEARPLSLADILKDDATLPDRAAARIGRQLVAAVAYAHSLPEPVVHRDIKPSNILFTGSGDVVLSDFGVAKRLTADGSVAVETTTTNSRRQGLFVGTFAYSAPEQQNGGEVTPATDYYAIGAILYEAITGRKPRSLEMPSEVSSTGASRKWDALLKRMLQPDPSLRLTDPAVIDAALAQIEGERPGRRRWITIAAAAAAVVGAALAVFAFRAFSGFPSKGANPADVADATPRRMEIALPGGLQLGFAWIADGRGFWIAEHELTAAESAAIFGQPVEVPEDRKDKPILAHFGATSPEVHLMAANLIPLPEGRRLDIPTEAEWEAAARVGLIGPSPEICREPHGPLGSVKRPPHVIRKASERLLADGGTPAAFRFVLR